MPSASNIPELSTASPQLGEVPHTPSSGDQFETKGPLLSWARSDPEQRFGFRGGRHTSVNTFLSALIATGLTALFFAAVIFVPGVADSHFAEMFLDRGGVPYAIVFLSMWAVSILFFKWRKLALQKKALRISILPGANDFVLSPTTVDDVFNRIYDATDDPRHFVVLNRVVIALANLKNLGRVTDVDEILRSQAENDEIAMETSYSLVQGFIWAIPVLGFIGTVLGLSAAIGSFGDVIGSASELSEITSSLKGVTAGLAVAFETTLEALVAALVIQLAVTFLRKSEEEFLDHCREFCHRNVVNRLRMTPFDPLEASDPE